MRILAKLFTSLVLVLGLVTPALAVGSDIGNITANGQSVCRRTFGEANGTVKISGTWTGTITFRGSIDQNVTQFDILASTIGTTNTVTSATANGQWAFSNALTHFCAVATAAVTGTVNIHIYTTQYGGGGGGGSALANGSNVDNKNNAVVVPEICNPHLTSQVPIALSASGNTEIVALTSGQTIYICDIDFVTSGAVTVKYIYGTGSACATGETAISGVISYGANSGTAKYYDGRLKTAEANAFCIKLGGAVGVNGVLTYRKIPTI